VERDRLAEIEEALGAGRLGLARSAGRDAAAAELFLRGGRLPEGAGARLGHDADGRCLFLETRDRGLCAVHRQLGPAALPAACRQFPRRCVVEERRVAVSLSHYCPTAAALLLEEREVERVEAPPALGGGGRWEGLDARAIGAAQLRPGVLLNAEAFDEWERRGLALLASGDDPDSSVARLARAAERARSWAVGAGSVARFVSGAFGDDAVGERGWAERLEGAEKVRRAAPEPWRAPGRRPREEVFERRVRPAFRRESRLLGRYLGTRFFACWGLFLGGGLRSHAAWVGLALDVLAVEAAQRAEAAGAEPGPADLLEAIRETDLRLLHLADPGLLTRGLEDQPAWRPW
jgi:hypothetical protein